MNCGIDGDSNCNYTKAAVKYGSGRGLRTVVVNKRGYLNSTLRNKNIVSHTVTTDFEFTISKFKQLFGRANFYCLGLSQGSNHLLNYVSAKQHQEDIKGVCIIGNPWNFYRVVFYAQVNFI